MKNIIFIIALITGISCGSCSKNEDTACTDTPVAAAPAAETEALERYLTSNNITAEKDSRGFYYKVESAGSGAHPDGCSNVTVNYKGWLTSGTLFDEGNNISFRVNTLISGWVAGIPLIAEGGKITLYLPPSLAYGSQGTNSIPPNSILIFAIELVNIQ